MKLFDLVELAGRNLREAGLRNSLTTLGISVGVASLVATVSLGIGLQRLIGQAMGRSGLFDSVFVTQRQDIRGTRLAQGDLTPPKPLDDAARKTFEKLQGVQEVYSYFSAMGEFRLKETRPEDSHFSVVGGLPPSARKSEAFDDVQGQFFSAEDAPEAIILADFGRVLLNLPPEAANADPKLSPEQVNKLLGKTLILRFGQRANDTPVAGARGDPPQDPSTFNVVRKEQSLKIVGIVNNEPYRGIGGGPGRRAVLMPVLFAESLNMMQPGDVRSLISGGEGRRYNALVVRVTKSQDVTRIEGQLKKLGFNAFSIVDFSQNVTKVFRFVDMFLLIFGSLALAVASLGIVNTLVTAVLERRREIGIMKALGASEGDVKQIFFVEAGCMGVFGGALGAGLGWLIGRLINFGTNVYLQSNFGEAKPQNFWYVPLWLAIAAITFSVLVSLWAGMYPASRAAKLDPVQALRHE